MSNKNKTHGKYFENRVATMLRESLNLNDNECTRSPNSGNGEFEFGDIYFNDPIRCPFSIECKFGYEWDLQTMFPSLNKQLTKFLNQSLEAKNKLETKMNVKCQLNCVIISKPYHKIYVLTYERLCDTIPYISTTDASGKSVFIYEMESLLGSEFFEKCRRTGK